MQSPSQIPSSPTREWHERNEKDTSWVLGFQNDLLKKLFDVFSRSFRKIATILRTQFQAIEKIKKEVPNRRFMIEYEADVYFFARKILNRENVKSQTEFLNKITQWKRKPWKKSHFGLLCKLYIIQFRTVFIATVFMARWRFL